MPSRVQSRMPPGAVWHQKWLHFTALHWPYPPEAVQVVLPPQLRVDIFDGQAWVGVTPLIMAGVRPRGLPPLPWLSRFAEVNVRTFVTGPDGSDGLWFFSLEAARLPFVLAARAAYGVPYVWASMRGSGPDDGTSSHVSRRRWPWSGVDRVRVEVKVGEAVPEAEVTDLDVFLTGRWRAFSRHPAGLLVTEISHPPWPLHRGTLVDLDQTLLARAGLPPPEGSPEVHYSPGVDVLMGLPRRARGA
ncbi:MAG: YqjF family protein [Acidimicrobiales bacterium]